MLRRQDLDPVARDAEPRSDEHDIRFTDGALHRTATTPSRPSTKLRVVRCKWASSCDPRSNGSNGNEPCEQPD